MGFKEGPAEGMYVCCGMRRIFLAFLDSEKDCDVWNYWSPPAQMLPNHDSNSPLCSYQ